jgi:hypothetical protein
MSARTNANATTAPVHAPALFLTIQTNNPSSPSKTGVWFVCAFKQNKEQEHNI